MGSDGRRRLEPGRLLRLSPAVVAVATAVAIAAVAPVAAAAPVRIGLIDSGLGPGDPTGHGTAVGAALRRSLGGTPARILAYPDLNRAGFPQPRLMAKAIREAAADGVSLVNISQTIPGRAPRVRRAIAAAPRTLFVVAAGNEGFDLDALDLERDPCTAPARNVICVAATDGNGLASFSNRGRISVDAAAPGAGTSFAAPKITAGAARLLATHPDWSLGQVRRATIRRFPVPAR